MKVKKKHMNIWLNQIFILDNAILYSFYIVSQLVKVFVYPKIYHFSQFIENAYSELENKVFISSLWTLHWTFHLLCIIARVSAKVVYRRILCKDKLIIVTRLYYKCNKHNVKTYIPVCKREYLIILLNAHILISWNVLVRYSVAMNRRVLAASGTKITPGYRNDY